MGTYYKYVNHTKREVVRLNDLRDGGDKWGAALACGDALVYLLCPHRSHERPLQGTWAGDQVEVVPDYADRSPAFPAVEYHDDYTIEGYAEENHPDRFYRHIGEALAAEMKAVGIERKYSL